MLVKVIECKVILYLQDQLLLDKTVDLKTRMHCNIIPTKGDGY